MSTIEELTELINRVEDLNPELEQYRDKVAGFDSIRHPLVFSIMHHSMMNAHLNAQFKYKKERLAKAEDEKDWGCYIFLHERPYRFEAFIRISNDLSDKEYWNLLGDIWSDTENLWQYHSFVPKLLKSKRAWRENMMDQEEQDLLATLPDYVAVYRGHQYINKDGYAWSLSYWNAKWFSQRFNKSKNGVIKGFVAKENIIACLLGRKEAEVIVDPDNVMDKKPVRFSHSKWKNIRECASKMFALGKSSHHGPWHWDKVEMNAIALAEATPGADIEVCRMFAFIHDCKRENENSDTEHGERSGKYVMNLPLSLTLNQIYKLRDACIGHEKGLVTDDPTIGVCWDADRLDLIRVGIIPDPALLSTKAAKEMLWKI